MAIPVKDHIHLGLSTPPTDDRWTVHFDKQYPRKPEIIMSAGRGMTGKLNVAVLGDTNGPLVLENWRGLTLVIDDKDDLDTLIGMLGKTCYFVPPNHADSGDEPADADILTVRFVKIDGIGVLDQAQQYWYPSISLEDDENVVVYVP